jgi:hypothetical protein
VFGTLTRHSSCGFKRWIWYSITGSCSTVSSAASRRELASLSAVVWIAGVQRMTRHRLARWCRLDGEAFRFEIATCRGHRGGGREVDAIDDGHRTCQIGPNRNESETEGQEGRLGECSGISPERLASKAAAVPPSGLPRQLVHAPPHETSSTTNSTADSTAPHATAPTQSQIDVRLPMKTKAAASEQPAAIVRSSGRFSFAFAPHSGGSIATNPPEQKAAASAKAALRALDVFVRTAWLSTAARWLERHPSHV